MIRMKPKIAFLAKIQHRFRKARFRRVQALIEMLLSEKESIAILDAGGRGEYWKMLPDDLRGRVHIQVMNYSDELTAYGMAGNGLNIDNISGNACSMPQYADGEFDLVHSNSVIEHVGSYRNMLQFAQETRRVGRFYYIQTPNYFFPIDPHYSFPFIHWLPDTLKVWALTNFKVGTAITSGFTDALAEVDNCKMLGKWTFRKLYPDAQHLNERFLLIFRKSFIAIGSAFSKNDI